MADTDNCLNYLLPAERDSEIISSLRTAKESVDMCKVNAVLKNCSSHVLSGTTNDSLDVIHCVIFF